MNIRRSIDQRYNGKWRARWLHPETGKWNTKSGFATKRAAREWLDEQVAVVSDLRLPIHGGSATQTVDEFAEHFFWKTESVKGSTLSTYKSAYVNHIRGRWGDVKWSHVRRADIELWRASLTDKCGQSTVRKAYWLFHKMADRAVDAEVLARSPFPRKSRVGRPAPRKPRPLDPHELQLLADELEPLYGLFILTLAYGGFRISEGAALRVNDLDFINNEISVDEAVSGNGFDPLLKTSRSHRSVPMPSLVMDELKVAVAGRRNDDLVFASSWNKPIWPPNFRNRYFNPARKKIGLPDITPHTLRHTAASMWFDAGFDIVEVARFLGDTLKTAEEVYTHMFKGRQREQVQALNARIEEGRSPKVVPIRKRQSSDASRPAAAAESP